MLLVLGLTEERRLLFLDYTLVIMLLIPVFLLKGGEPPVRISSDELLTTEHNYFAYLLSFHCNKDYKYKDGSSWLAAL